jgi:hypothetical protein
VVQKKGLLSYLIGSVVKNEIDNIKYNISYYILAKIGISHFKIAIILMVLV